MNNMAGSNATLLPERILAVVADAVMLTPEIRGIKLAAEDGEALPPAEPGSHIDIWLPDGNVRQYSIVERSADGKTYQIAVLRERASRGGSAYIVDSLSAGAKVTLSQPRNHFALVEHAEEYILIAGGIGITPILPMARALVSAGKQVELHYLVRSRERAALLDIIESAPLKQVAKLHFSGDGGEVDLRRIIGSPRPGTHIFVCGPARLIDGVLQTAREWPADSLHFERFAAAPVDSKENAEFEIELACSKRKFSVPANSSILDVLREHNVPIESLCAEGVCGTCAVSLLAGEADHRDALQTDAEKAEQKVIYVCVSRAKSRSLLLDL